MPSHVIVGCYTLTCFLIVFLISLFLINNLMQKIFFPFLAFKTNKAISMLPNDARYRMKMERK